MRYLLLLILALATTNVHAQHWINKDGLSIRAHVEQRHGISTAGMSEAQVRQVHDAWHKKHGNGHNQAAQRQRLFQRLFRRYS